MIPKLSQTSSITNQKNFTNKYILLSSHKFAEKTSVGPRAGLVSGRGLKARAVMEKNLSVYFQIILAYFEFDWSKWVDISLNYA